jgi:hypothetical protein
MTELTTRARFSREERMLSVGAAREDAARANLSVLAADGVDPSDGRVRAGKSRLAEALAMRGRFEEAAAVEPREDVSGRYREIHEAVWREDEDACDCPPAVRDERGPRGTVIEVPTSFVEEIVFSGKHGREMPLVRCASCGDLNVKSRTPELERLHETRAESARLARGLSVAEVIRRL